MFEQTLRFLTDDGWPVAPGEHDGLPCIDTHFLGTDAEWDCRARPYDPFGQLAFESVLPFVVAPEHRPAVTELVVRTNWRLLTGAFQLDLDTGDAVFRTMLFLSHGAEPTDGLLRGLVYGNVLTVDRCLAELAGVAAGGEPAGALARLAL
ncbi:YbjN domain-containing protein [Nocardioides sp.]|uniref:YbjN domain-containing protein n=1 Tax=Nocardioides sp. TaxID=35761 RepID=UPI0027233B9C|nr:YbjN domain-containing protein [Nocardioides sp.]MDO9456254.1 YbjN domain-containing protein [Nocardioides sp.]